MSLDNSARNDTATNAPQPNSRHQANRVLDAELKDALATLTVEDEVLLDGMVCVDGMRLVATNSTRTTTGPVAIAVSNRAVFFVEIDRQTSTSKRVKVPYCDIEAATLDRSEGELELLTGERREAHIPFPDPDADERHPVVRHLSWVGTLRKDVTTTVAETQATLDTIHEFVENGELDEATAEYDRVRERLDDLLGQVLLADLSPTVLTPELIEIDPELEEAKSRIECGRALASCELGATLLGNGDYEPAARMLTEAHEHHQSAQSHREESNWDNELLFGRQRELAEVLTEVEERLDSVSNRPLELANQACSAATDADDPEQRVTLWEQAVCHYGSLYDHLTASTSPMFEGQAAKINVQLQTAKDRLATARSDTE
jgi:hypothetical protein